MALPDHINDREFQKFVEYDGLPAVRVVIVSGGGGGGGSGGYVPTNTSSTPLILDGSTTITPAGEQREILYVASNGGLVTNTVNPQIANGTIHGQELLLVGTSDTDKIKLDQANNLVLNGDCTLKNGSTLLLFWNQTDWAEISRNDL